MGSKKLKKGVSTVIATLIIVSTVFAMFAIIYPWAMSSLTLSQSSAGLWYLSQEAAIKERVVIEMVVFKADATGRYIDVYVRNVGEIDVEIVAFYINGSSQINVNPPLPKRIYVSVEGAENVVCFTITYPWSDGVIYRIKAVTSRGNEAIFEAKR
ncbi:MAG: hypothetical protein QXN41_00565 [Candidatus Bathyarchaeia archaeon]